MAESFDYSEEDGFFDRLRSWDVDVDELLEESREQQKAWLQKEIERINDQLEQRDAVHGDIVAELEWKIDRYSDRLEKLYSQTRGKRDGERDRIKDRIETFYQELREEHRQHWRDRQQLEEERRDILRELDEVRTDYRIDS